MTEIKPFHLQMLAEKNLTLPPPPLSRTKIDVTWQETSARAVKIRQSYVEAAERACHLHFRHNLRSGPDVRPAL